MSNKVKKEDRSFLGGKPLCHIGYGAMRLPGMRGTDANEKLAHQLLQQAIELGVNIIDTADYYGNGLANRFICDALAPYSNGLMISTKVGAKAGEKGPPIPAATTDEIIASVNRNLESLRTDVLDIVFLRLAGGPLSDSGVPIEESVSVLESLRQKGLIKHIGLSSVTPEQLDVANSITNIDAVQNAYFIGQTSSRQVLQKCTSKKIPFFAYFPLGMGKLSTNSLVQEIALKYKISESRLALAWLLHLSPVIVPIPGTSSLDHLKENISASEIELEEADIESLGNIVA